MHVAPSLTLVAAAAPQTRAWSGRARVAFRFAFVYLALYSLTEITMVFDQSDTSLGDRLWLPAVRWFAAHILRSTTPMRPDAGSGDTSFAYVQLLVYVVLATLATLSWSALDRRRLHYEPLLEALRLWLGYFILCTMLSYGLAKVLPLQFPPIGPAHLLEPYGRASPMGLLWTFMGASRGYTCFGGLGELAGGLLIVFRRTALVGALIVAAVMTNVLVLNLCYDVCVKVFAAHVVLIALMLVALDRRRLLALVGVAVPAAAPRLWFARPRTRRIAFGLEALAIVGAIVAQSWLTYRDYREYNQPPGPLDGAYRFERLVKDGTPQTLLAGDDDAWRSLAITRYGIAIVKMNDVSDRYRLVPAADGTQLADAEEKSLLRVSHSDPAHLVLDGQLADPTTHALTQLHAELRRIDPSEWLLTNRGFHFVNERSFNR